MGQRIVVVVACLLGCACSDAPGGAFTGGDGGVPVDPLEPLDRPPALPPPLCQIAIDCPSQIVDEPKIDCAGAVHHGDGTEQYAGQIGVEVRGRSSKQYPKLNYAIELRDAAGMGLSVNLLGMGGESDWVLDGSWVDRSFLRNPLVFDLHRSLGGAARYAPRSRFCQLLLDGEDVGIYRLTERIKRDDDRLAIAADDGTGSSFVIKQDDEGAARWDVGEQSRWKLVYPREQLATDAQVAGIQALLDALEDAARAPQGSDARAAMFTLVDIDAMVDWVIVQELAKNVDAYNLSLHLWRNAGGLAQPVPWDFDLSMGQPSVDAIADNERPQGWARRLSHFVQAMATVPAFQQRLTQRWRMHRAGPLASERVTARIDHYLTTLEPDAIDRNFARWPIEDVDFRQIYRPYSLYTVSSYDDEVERLRTWLDARLIWIDDNIGRYVDGND